MKLIKCYVSSFGKLNDFTFDFSQGLNTVKEENGWGKSTFSVFIKSMFYGISSTKSTDIEKNDRYKYKPWNSTAKFGGYIIFSWGNNEYKIERYFGNKESEDTVSIIDNRTGKPFNDTENLGNRIFGIDEAGFLSTTYFSQKEFEIKSNSSITAKFNSVLDDQTEKYDKVISKLEDKLKTYSKVSGSRGLIANIKSEIFDIDEEIKRANSVGNTVNDLNGQVKVLENEINSLRQESKMLAEKISVASKQEAIKLKADNYQSYLNKRESLIAEKDKLNQVLNGNAVLDEDIETLKTCCKSYFDIREQKNNLMGENFSNNVKGKRNFTPLFIVFALLLFAGVGLVFVNTAIGLSVIGVFVIATVLSLIFIPKSKVNNDAKEREKLISEYMQTEEKCKQGIDRYLSKFSVDRSDIFSAVNTIEQTVREYRRITSEIEELDKVILNLEKDEDLKNQTSPQAESLNLLRERSLEVQRLYDEKIESLAQKKSSISYYEGLENVEELQEERREKQNILAKYEEDYRILNLTLEYIKKADENLKVKYRKPLEDSLNKYAKLISNVDKPINIDIDLNITMQEKDGNKKVEYYSKGWQNLFDICKRFALADILFTGEKPFIILDDPFYNLDDEKLKACLNLIKELSKDYQILYLVCHESRMA